ncbi:MAG TPA: HdeD family acid-resistance protein [Gemmatimonadales bacterium]|nr:HdeD family acid-resistance protein [Gemmatimonadales bacterium]
MRVALIDLESLSRNWWAVVLRGVAGILFGIITFIAPIISLATLVLLWGAYAFVDGVLAIVTAARRRGADRWWLLLLEGVSGVLAGILTWIWPGITALVLLYLIAAWALVTGVLELATAVRLRKVLTNEWLLALSGILSIALGIFLALVPGPGALVLVLWIGAYAFVFGVVLVALGVKLHRLGSAHHRPMAAGVV